MGTIQVTVHTYVSMCVCMLLPLSCVYFVRAMCVFVHKACVKFVVCVCVCVLTDLSLTNGRGGL